MERYTISKEMSGMGCGDIKYYIEQYEKMLRDKENIIQVLQDEKKKKKKKKEWTFKEALYDLERELYQQMVVLGQKISYTAISGLISQMIEKEELKNGKGKVR